jgi:hypothetical protein
MVKVAVKKLNHGKLPYWRLPNCQHMITSVPPRYKGEAPRQCKHKAYYDYDGMLLCERHAGDRALAFLLAV